MNPLSDTTSRAIQAAFSLCNESASLLRRSRVEALVPEYRLEAA